MAQHRVLGAHAAAVLRSSIFSSEDPRLAPHPNSWVLLYHSDIHGKSFQRMVQLCVDRGPTVFVIKDAASHRVFGGYNEAPWTTVATREKEAKSMAAGNARARREGIDSAVVSRPENQSTVFYGNERCFLFRVDPPSSSSTATEGNEGEPPGAEEAVHVYHSRPSINANFMYLFDQHPDESKIGIGMGGQANYFGWFLDRWLETGVCKGTRCTTFYNPMLSITEEWPVESIEVYAVGTAVVEDLMEQMQSADITGGKTLRDTGESVRKGEGCMPDKVILEMHNHRFYGDEEREC